MFATLRYSPLNKNGAYVSLSDSSQPPFRGHGHQHSACDGCRQAKLRCTGQRTGCDRCRKKKIACIFSGPSEGKGDSKRRCRGNLPKEPEGLTTESRPATSATVAHVTTLDPVVLSSEGKKRAGESPSKDGTSDPEVILLSTTSNVSDNGEEKAAEEGDILDEFPRWDIHQTHSSRSEDSDLFTKLDFRYEEAAPNDILGGVTTPADDIEGFLKDFTQDTASPLSPDSPQQNFSLTLPTPTSMDLEIPALSQPASELQSHAKVCRSAASLISPDMEIDFSTTPPRDGCLCIQVAIGLLDQLELEDAEDVDRILSDQKKALQKCNEILDCSACSVRAGVVTLLVVICEKMVGSVEAVSKSCENQTERASVQTEKRKSTRRRSSVFRETEGVFLGRYEIDSSSEWWSIISVIITGIMESLRGVMIRLKSSAANFNCQTQLKMLASLDQALEEVSHRMRRI